MDRAYKQKIREIMDAEGIAGTITCSQAFMSAGKSGIPLADIGHFCNSNQIKIRGCQRGCFR